MPNPLLLLSLWTHAEAAPTSQQLAVWQMWINTRTPPAAVSGSISDSEGQVWDCVDRRRQAGFRRRALAQATYLAWIVDNATADGQPLTDQQAKDMTDAEFANGQHPQLVNYTLSQAAGLLSAAIEDAASDSAAPPSSGTEQQDWSSGIDISGECASGYVPVRRYVVADIAEVGSLHDLVYMIPPGGGGGSEVHEYSVVDDEGTFYGGKANFNLVRPDVEKSTEFSLAQIWVVRGSGGNRQTVELGWQHYQYRAKNKPVIFVFSTSDNYGPESAYDDDLGRWIQVSSSIAPGMRFKYYSTIDGDQYSVEFKVYRGTAQGNWNLAYDNTLMGYFPNSLFNSTGLASHAARVSMGGEIVDLHSSRHTKTDMGTGRFPSEGWRKAAYIRNMRVKDSLTTYQNFAVDGSFEEPGCYNVLPVNGGSWGRYIYYGGPGYHVVNCP